MQKIRKKLRSAEICIIDKVYEKATDGRAVLKKQSVLLQVEVILAPK